MTILDRAPAPLASAGDHDPTGVVTLLSVDGGPRVRLGTDVQYVVGRYLNDTVLFTRNNLTGTSVSCSKSGETADG